MQGQVPISELALRRELARALDGLGPARGEPSPATRLYEWLRETIGQENLERIGQALLVVLVLAALVALLRFALGVARSGRRPLARGAETDAEGPDPAERARELAAAARAARAAGDLRLALRLFLHAVLVALGGRGDLELRPAWTNRELLRRGNPSRAARALLEPLVRELEPKEFGRAPVGAADVERLEGLLAEHLEAPGAQP